MSRPQRAFYPPIVPNPLYTRVKQELNGMEHVRSIAEGDGFELFDFGGRHGVLIVEHHAARDFAPIHAALEKAPGVVEAALIGGAKSARGEIKKARPKGLFSKHKFLWSHLSEDRKVWNSGTQLGPSLLKVLKSVAKGREVGAAPQPRPIGKIGAIAVVLGLAVFWGLRVLFKLSISGDG